MRLLTSRSAAALSIVAGFAVAAPAQAQTKTEPSPPAAESPSAIARAGIETLLKAIELALKSFPQYEMPRVNDRGDIIIRRVNPPKEENRKAPPPPEESSRT